MTEEEQTNIDQFFEVVRKTDPELYLIKMALKETNLNPLIVPKIVQSVANLAFGSGFGKVQIFMKARTITTINGEEAHNVNLPAILEEEK